jgi:hypothetical protein
MRLSEEDTRGPLTNLNPGRFVPFFRSRLSWGRNPVGVGEFCDVVTQGSAGGATLGFEAESRWDSGRAELGSGDGSALVRRALQPWTSGGLEFRRLA